MNKLALLLPVLALPAVALAQAPAPSLGEQVRVTRPEVEKLLASYQFQEALQKAQALLPPTRPAFDKTNNQTMVESCVRAIDLGQAYRLAVETADAAGQWEKALDYAKEAKAIASESYPIIKDPFQKMVDYYESEGKQANQTLKENAAEIQRLKEKKDLDPSEKQELDLALGVEKNAASDAKWIKFFQTYLNAAKEEVTAYDPLISVMEKKLQGEADQIAEYKAGKGDKLKWVEAVLSSPAYLEAQGDTSGKLRWLNRLAVLAPENRKVQHLMDVLTGKVKPEPTPKHHVRKRR